MRKGIPLASLYRQPQRQYTDIAVFTSKQTNSGENERHVGSHYIGCPICVDYLDHEYTLQIDRKTNSAFGC